MAQATIGQVSSILFSSPADKRIHYSPPAYIEQHRSFPQGPLASTPFQLNDLFRLLSERSLFSIKPICRSVLMAQLLFAFPFVEPFAMLLNNKFTYVKRSRELNLPRNFSLSSVRFSTSKVSYRVNKDENISCLMKFNIEIDLIAAYSYQIRRKSIFSCRCSLVLLLIDNVNC